jgi:hypothetical protein
MKIRNKLKRLLACAIFLAACHDTTGPKEAGYSLAVQAGDLQFGTSHSSLIEPLQVIVTDPATKTPQKDVLVTWTITEGGGAILSVPTSTTDSHGVASTQLILGAALGTYRVDATTAKIVGSPAHFTAHAVVAPVVSSVVPGTANAGDTLTLTGQNFSPTPDDNTVLFSGMRGKIVSATATQLRVVVPLCLPTRAVAVQAMLGAVAGNQVTLNVNGTTGTALALARGTVRLFSDPNELACFRLPGSAGLTLLLVPQNFSEVVGSITNIEVTGLTGTTLNAFASPQSFVQPAQDVGSTWEMHIRRSEQQMLRGPSASLRPQASLQSAASCTANPVLGATCSFQVINKDDKFQTVNAEVKAISTHAIVMQDVTAPANGLAAADFTQLGSMFDDPIYDTDVATFGAPSDLDANGRIVILLTPVVNALTPTNSSGFIAGFFYGCDLLTKTACAGTNGGEIFYALTADPTAQFSGARSRQQVMSALPPVLAHEFQHMINFFQRGSSADALWLAEGMAHDAEDVVADVYAQRSDLASAALFRAQNSTRGDRFLRATASTSLVADDDVGTLEQRGAAFLFVRYIQGQFGNDILKKLTQSKLSSVANVTAQTGKSWSSLISNWAVALWADHAPELQGATVAKEYTFTNLNLRSRFGGGIYPLQPDFFSFSDFIFNASLPASSQAYLIVQAGGANPKPLNLTFSGQRGGAFAANAAPQMSILRIQ